MKKVEPYLEAVKDEVSLPIAELWGIYPDIFANHYDSILNKGTEVGVDETTGEIVELLKTDAAKDYFTLMHEWKEKGYWKEENTMADVNKDTYRSAGDYGISIWNTVPDNENSASDRYGVPVYAIDQSFAVCRFLFMTIESCRLCFPYLLQVRVSSPPTPLQSFSPRIHASSIHRYLIRLR